MLWLVFVFGGLDFLLLTSLDNDVIVEPHLDDIQSTKFTTIGRIIDLISSMSQGCLLRSTVFFTRLFDIISISSIVTSVIVRLKHDKNRLHCCVFR